MTEFKICLNCGKKIFKDEKRFLNTLGEYNWNIIKFCSKDCSKEHFNKERNKWRKEHPKEYKKERDYYYQRMLENPEIEERYRNSLRKYGQTIKGRYNHYKTGAKQRGLIFSLTKEQFESFWQKPCYYCGGEINTIGLDRIDSSKNYTLNNIVPCCEKCNKMKLIMSQQDFINQCSKVYKYQKSHLGFKGAAL